MLLAPTWGQTCLSFYQPVAHVAIPGMWGICPLDQGYTGLLTLPLSPSLLTPEELHFQLGKSHLLGSGQTISVL